MKTQVRWMTAYCCEGEVTKLAGSGCCWCSLCNGALVQIDDATFFLNPCLAPPDIKFSFSRAFDYQKSVADL